MLLWHVIWVADAPFFRFRSAPASSEVAMSIISDQGKAFYHYVLLVSVFPAIGTLLAGRRRELPPHAFMSVQHRRISRVHDQSLVEHGDEAQPAFPCAVRKSERSPFRNATSPLLPYATSLSRFRTWRLSSDSHPSGFSFVPR